MVFLESELVLWHCSRQQELKRGKIRFLEHRPNNPSVFFLILSHYYKKNQAGALPLPFNEFSWNLTDGHLPFSQMELSYRCLELPARRCQIFQSWRKGTGRWGCFSCWSGPRFFHVLSISETLWSAGARAVGPRGITIRQSLAGGPIEDLRGWAG